MKKWLIAGIFGTATVGGLGVGVIWQFFPIEWADWKATRELRKAGVRDVDLDGQHAFLRDHCGESVDATGACRCVVLIPGLGDSAMTWKSALLRPKQAWKTPVRLYALDPPGAGGSPPPTDPQDYRVSRQARRLRETLAKRCSRWAVVGNSLGGWTAAWVALQWPEGVRSLVLLDAAGLKKAADLTVEPSARQMITQPSVESLKEFQRRAYFHPRPLPENVWRAAVRRAERGHSRETAAAQSAEDDLDGRLPRLHAPTLVIWGAADRIIPPEAGRRMATAIPGARYVELPRCGHLPQKECPSAWFEAWDTWPDWANGTGWN